MAVYHTNTYLGLYNVPGVAEADVVIRVVEPQAVFKILFSILAHLQTSKDLREMLGYEYNVMWEKKYLLVFLSRFAVQI